MNIIELIDENGQSEFVQHIDGLSVIFQGSDNHITVAKGTKFRNCNFLLGGKNTFSFGYSRYTINNIKLWANNYTRFIVGRNFSCLGLDVRLQENYTGIEIGNECMFSFDICFYPTDGHAIISNDSGKCINALAKTIKIGDHCWCGRRVTFLKSSDIPSNTIIGFGSVVTKPFLDQYTIIAGYPAKVISTGKSWSREDPWTYQHLHKGL